MNPHKMTTRRPTRDRYTATVSYSDPDPLTAGGGVSHTIDHTVEITPADQLRAEILGYQFSIGPMSEAPLHYTLLWIYAALVREGHYAEDWPTFLECDLYAWGPADAFEGGEGDPDPTPASGPLEFG